MVKIKKKYIMYDISHNPNINIYLLLVFLLFFFFFADFGYHKCHQFFLFQSINQSSNPKKNQTTKIKTSKNKKKEEETFLFVISKIICSVPKMLAKLNTNPLYK